MHCKNSVFHISLFNSSQNIEHVNMLCITSNTVCWVVNELKLKRNKTKLEMFCHFHFSFIRRTHRFFTVCPLCGHMNIIFSTFICIVHIIWTFYSNTNCWKFYSSELWIHKKCNQNQLVNKTCLENGSLDSKNVKGQTRVWNKI